MRGCCRAGSLPQWLAVILVAGFSLSAVSLAAQTTPTPTPAPSPTPPSVVANALGFLLQSRERPAQAGTDANTRRGSILSALHVLRSENQKISSPTKGQIDAQLQALIEQELAMPPAEHEDLSGLDSLVKLYDPDLVAQARALAAQYRCPMHPEVIGKEGAICPKCGMALTSLVRLSPDSRNPPLMRYTIRSQVEIEAPLQVGKEVRAHLILTSLRNGEPVTLDQLREVHTRKIHLLINDGSLTDYHHVHPTPSDLPGRYDFSFTPQKPGPYRVWADLEPLATGIQEYALALILADTHAEPLVKEPDRLTTTLNHLHYTLSFDRPLKSGEPARGTLHIAQDDGTPFTELEPVMATFAHIVGFREDRTTALHIHPEIAAPPQRDDRGGPDLHFRFYAAKPGFYRLFAQIQRHGEQEFPSFTINVAQGPMPPGWQKNNCSSGRSRPTVFTYGIRITEITLPERCAGTAHRCENDGNPSRQTSRRLRRECEQGDRRQG
jgi:hypothetical protein